MAYTRIRNFKLNKPNLTPEIPDNNLYMQTYTRVYMVYTRKRGLKSSTHNFPPKISHNNFEPEYDIFAKKYV